MLILLLLLLSESDRRSTFFFLFILSWSTYKQLSLAPNKMSHILIGYKFNALEMTKIYVLAHNLSLFLV